MAYICVPEKYQKDGEEKVKFNRVGEVFKGKNGKTYAKLYSIPGVLLHVFEQDKKDEPKASESGDFDEFGADNKVPF